MVGALGGALARSSDARAADGDALKLGAANVASGTTELTTTGSIADGAALDVAAPNADYGVMSSARSIGVYGKGPIGVYGEGAVGGVFSGSDAAISLTPRGSSGPPAGESLKGDVLVDADGVLWLCVSDGTPGKWIRVSHGGTRTLPSPQRPYDSRRPGAGGAFAPNSTREIAITAAGIGVPVNALGIVANLTITNPNDFGFLAAFPAGTARPEASNLNWETGQPAGRISGWRNEFLAAGREGLKSRPTPIEDVTLREAQRKVGELSMEVDILKALLEKKGHPPFPRR